MRLFCFTRVEIRYGALQMLHVVFGLFFALLIVCAIRGLSLHLAALSHKIRSPSLQPAAVT